MRISDLMPQGTTGLSGALQSASPLLLAMGQGLSSGQGINAFMPQGMAGMMALQERQKEKAANDKLDEMLGTFNVSPAERALLSTMDLSGKQQYLANLMQSRRTGGGGGSGIDPAMWESIMGGQPAGQPSGAGMLSMGMPATMGGQERGQLSFGLPEADTGAPLQGAAGMMGQSVPQQPAQPLQRPPMGSPASLSFGQIEQQPAQADPMAQIRQIEARMMQVSQLPPSKTTTAAMNALQARREILMAQAERNQPPEDPIADLRARFEFAQRELGMDPQQAGQWARSGQQINVNSIPPAPSGYRNVFDDSGKVIGQEPIPGGPADFSRKQDEAAANAEAEAAAQQEQARQEQATTQADTVLQTIGEIKAITDNAGWFDIPETGIVGDAAARWGVNQEAVDVRNKIASLESAIAFDRLQRMREASPTGGALGAVSERELTLLAADLGSLRQSSSKQEFEKVLRRVEDRYKEIMRKFSAYPSRSQPAPTDPNDPLGIRK